MSDRENSTRQRRCVRLFASHAACNGVSPERKLPVDHSLLDLKTCRKGPLVGCLQSLDKAPFFSVLCSFCGMIMSPCFMTLEEDCLISRWSDYFQTWISTTCPSASLKHSSSCPTVSQNKVFFIGNTFLRPVDTSLREVNPNFNLRQDHKRRLFNWKCICPPSWYRSASSKPGIKTRLDFT